MGIRRSPVPQKASRIEAGAIARFLQAQRIVETIIERTDGRDGVCASYAILFGATVLIIASEAITSQAKKCPFKE